MQKEILNDILKGYIEAALWTEEERLREDYYNIHGAEEDDEDNFDDELEKIVRISSNMHKKSFEDFSREDIESDSLIKAYTDIKKFIELATDDVIEMSIVDDNIEPDRIGHDFWLTRNGHGAGFFDGHYSSENEESLMSAAKKMGSVDLYINDNNKLSFSNEHIYESKNTLSIKVSKEDLEYINESLKSGEVLKEDLRRWFKEKWVDVSRKVGGKHPPCGRSKASTKGYPKCRPSKKVSKDTPKTSGSYSKSEKKSMTSQKRRAEKKEPKTGTGHKPTMTHYDENLQIKESKMNINLQNKIVELVLDEIHELHENRPPKLVLKESVEIISEGLMYHINNSKPLTENIYRVYSNKFFQLFNEARDLYKSGSVEFFGNDLELIKTDIGKVGLYEGRYVYLDIPFIDEEEDHLVEAKHRGKNVKLNKPFRTPGGPKKFAVYVKSKGGNIKKVTFGDPNLKIRSSNKKAAKSFRARHKCDQKKDRTTAGYWSCNISRYRKALGIKSSNPW